MPSKKIKISPNQHKLVLLILVPLALLVTILMVIDLMSSQPTENLINDLPEEDTIENIQALIALQEKDEPIVRGEVPTDVFVPEPTMTLTDEQKKIVAVPEVSAPAAPGVSSKLRIFNLVGENNQISPYVIAVRDGDSVRINLQAIDQDYDLTIPDLGMQIVVSQGSDRNLGFQANGVGSLDFYCQRCGGSADNPQGNIFIDYPQ